MADKELVEQLRRCGRDRDKRCVVLAFWRLSFVRRNWREPTVRELCAAAGWRSPGTGAEYMREMRSRGLIPVPVERPVEVVK
jgi:hypothetical protein